MKYDYYIGIDPDSVKSGVACVEVATRRVEAVAEVLEGQRPKNHARGNRGDNGYRWTHEPRGARCVVAGVGRGEFADTNQERQKIEIGARAAAAVRRF